MKKFKNRHNLCHKVGDKVVWESRSVAVTGTIMILNQNKIYVLVGKRGKNSADFQGKWNLICGYLDWDETLQEAMEREIWEEAGLDLNLIKRCLHQDNLIEPWRINSDPNANRQNVSIHFGCLSDMTYFPELTTEYNEVVDETEELKWLPVEDVYKYEWAFNHDKIIELYLEKIKTR